jgi:hypothetical protein
MKIKANLIPTPFRVIFYTNPPLTSPKVEPKKKFSCQVRKSEHNFSVCQMLKQVKYNRLFEPRIVILRFLFRLGDMIKMSKNHSKAARLFLYQR